MVAPRKTVLRPFRRVSEKGPPALDQTLEAESTGPQAPGVCTGETARLIEKLPTPQVHTP